LSITNVSGIIARKYYSAESKKQDTEGKEGL
jgi:hypothetical protein